MQHIPEHIKMLLQEHPEVSVPQEGTYRVVLHSAAICGGQLMPPSASVVFVPQDGGQAIAFDAAECAFLPHNLGWKPVALQDRIIPMKSEENVVTIHVRKSILRYAAASVIGLIMLAVSPKGNESMRADYAALSPAPYAEILAERARIQAEEEAARLAEMEAIVRPYHLVVASLDNQAADKYAAKLAEEGYKVHLLAHKPGYARVAIAKYATIEEALAAMEEARQEESFKRAWVCKD